MDLTAVRADYAFTIKTIVSRHSFHSCNDGCAVCRRADFLDCLEIVQDCRIDPGLHVIGDHLLRVTLLIPFDQARVYY